MPQIYMMFSTHPSILAFLSLSFFILSSISLAFQFPDDWNYRLVNDPKQPLSTNGDYGSTYRCYAGTPYDDFVMSFCFFNTTPNAYTLALGTGTYSYPGNDAGRWVWAANTNRPVREGAGVFLLPDGNLILYDVDGRVAWQSNTTNKADGWVTIKTRINDMYGDLVLVNTKDDIPFWQSFDHPQYTLFPNQVLNVSGAEIDKLVSYRSALGGRYTMMMSTKSLDLYYKCANCPKALKYYTLFKTTKALNNVVFSLQSTTPTLIQNFADGTQGKFEFPNLGGPSADFTFLTMFLRIEMDGNLKIYAYRQDPEDAFWIDAFKVFTKGGLTSNKQESECQLPEKCGNYGVCDQDVCVSCPSPKGLLPWTDKCMAPKLVGCSGGANVTYYKVEGVEHYNSKYTNGQKPVTLSSCESKCSLDCTCLGYFYHQENSACWVVSDLKTLTKSSNANHFGFIKMTN
ncbi:EP1-like glycoprotein 4 [Silene latifolia]|uniref:EP1-like glycoprotein 4 n=1 Tax=Silene latifolia TaxID=37657 RepID=UPI003D78AACB